MNRYSKFVVGMGISMWMLQGSIAVGDTDWDLCEDVLCDAPTTVAAEKDEDWVPWVYQEVNDWDGDGVSDNEDNCPFAYNPNQSDDDIEDDGESLPDGFGLACDNCPARTNSAQNDLDGDGIGDVCDNDVDGDAILDKNDNCPLVYNPEQSDLDGDSLLADADAGTVDVLDAGDLDAGDAEDVSVRHLGDLCDNDIDGDGLPNEMDPCPYQGPDFGDACNRDSDGDGIDDFQLSDKGAMPLDNCIAHPNEDQQDMDGDGIGDVCDPDIDGDGIMNSVDNCYRCEDESDEAECEYTDSINPDQADADRDGEGDACDNDFCFVVPALIDEAKTCLDPASKEFVVDTPNVYNANTGDWIPLRLFANRRNAGLQYSWRVTGAFAGTARLLNADGATGYSTPFEYRYMEGREPVLIPRKPGTYYVSVEVKQLYKDEVTQKTGVVADATATITVRGSSDVDATDCNCAQPGKSSGKNGLFGLLILGLAIWGIRKRR